MLGTDARMSAIMVCTEHREDRDLFQSTHPWMEGQRFDVRHSGRVIALEDLNRGS